MTQSSNPTALLAKLCVSRPNVAMTNILASGQVDQTLNQLRVYPAALSSLWNADNIPRALKGTIEDLLNSVGFSVLT